MKIEIILLLVGIASVAFSEKRYPPEQYIKNIKLINCDIRLAEIDYKCDMVFEKIDYRTETFYETADKFCSTAFEKLDKMCKNKETKFCDDAYEYREANCDKRIRDVNTFMMLEYKIQDELCNDEYDDYDKECGPGVPVKKPVVKPAVSKTPSKVTVPKKPQSKLPSKLKKISKPKKESSDWRKLVETLTGKPKSKRERNEVNFLAKLTSQIVAPSKPKAQKPKAQKPKAQKPKASSSLPKWLRNLAVSPPKSEKPKKPVKLIAKPAVSKKPLVKYQPPKPQVASKQKLASPNVSLPKAPKRNIPEKPTVSKPERDDYDPLSLAALQAALNKAVGQAEQSAPPPSFDFK